MAHPVIEYHLEDDDLLGGGTICRGNWSPPGTVGNLFILIIASDGDNTVVDWDRTDDFTPIFSISNGKDCSLHAAWRVVDETEGSIWEVEFSESESYSYVMVTISGHADPSTTPPEGTTATGDSDSPDPPNYNTGDGAKDYLWIGAMGSDRDQTVDAFPYSDSMNFSFPGAGAGDCSVGFSATDDLTAEEVNPGVFTISAADEWVAATIAVHPASAVGGSAMGFIMSRIKSFRNLLLR